jgi:hypothetical protein
MELLSFGIAFPFGGGHIARGDDQGPFVLFAHKENDQVAPGIGAAQRRVNMLSGSMPVFNKTKMGAVAQNLPDFILYDVVFAKELFNDFVNPDDPVDLLVNSPRFPLPYPCGPIDCGKPTLDVIIFPPARFFKLFLAAEEMLK